MKIALILTVYKCGTQRWDASALKRLQESVEGIKEGNSRIECFEVYELIKSKKQPVPKESTRAEENLDIVHGKVFPEAVVAFAKQLDL